MIVREFLSSLVGCSSVGGPLGKLFFLLWLKVEAVDERLDSVSSGGVCHSNLEDTVFIDVVLNDNLLLASRSRWNTTNDDLSNLSVFFCLILFTFEHFYGKFCLVILVCRKNGLSFTWNLRIALNDLFIFQLVFVTAEQPTKEALFYFVSNLHAK